MNLQCAISRDVPLERLYVNRTGTKEMAESTLEQGGGKGVEHGVGPRQLYDLKHNFDPLCRWLSISQEHKVVFAEEMLLIFAALLVQL